MQTPKKQNGAAAGFSGGFRGSGKGAPALTGLLLHDRVENQKYDIS